MSKHLKQRLQARIEHAGLTVNDLEKKAGLGTNAIRHILSEKTKNPGVDTIVAIAEVFGCSVDDLVKENKASIPQPETYKGIQTHTWKCNLFIEIVKFTDSYLIKKRYTPSFEDFSFFVKEIYLYSLGKDNEKINEQFAEWLIDKNIKII